MIRGVRDRDGFDEERGTATDGGSPGHSQTSSAFSSPLRTTEKPPSVSRVRLMSGEAVGDLVDFLVELLWYRRPDRLVSLEKQHETLSLTILVLAWYSSAVFTITTSKKLMLVLPLPFTLCTAQFTIATVMSAIITNYSLFENSISAASIQGRKAGGKPGVIGHEGVSVVEDNVTLLSMTSINSRVNKSGSITSGPGRIVSSNGGNMATNREREGSSNGVTDSGRSLGDAESGLSRGNKVGRPRGKTKTSCSSSHSPVSVAFWGYLRCHRHTLIPAYCI